MGPAGRTVRCAACKNTWHAQAPEKPIDLSLSDVKKKERVEDLQQVKAKKLPLKYRAILEDKKRVKALTAQGMIWAGMAVCLVAIIGLGLLLRVNIVRAFPSVAGAYAMVGMKTNGTHLDFGTYSGESAFKDGRFVVTIKAQIKNMSDKPTEVPPVRVKLYDATRQMFNSVLIPSNGLMVDGKATRTLVFDVADPKNLTSQLAMDFDLVALKQMKKAGANLRVTPVGAPEHGAGGGDAHEAAPADDHDAAEDEADTDSHEVAPADHPEAVASTEPSPLRSGDIAAPDHMASADAHGASDHKSGGHS